jgi:hypothetical protein
MQIDHREASFEELLRFVFDRPPPIDGELNAWWFRSHDDLLVDPRRQIAHLTRLFGDPSVLRPRYTDAQIEQGLWFLFSAAPEYYVKFLWSPEVPWPERENCLLALPTLYDRLLADGTIWPTEIDHMIPDLLADWYGFGWRKPATNEEDRRVQETLLHVFARLLASKAPSQWRAGFHGLGHLAHPKGADIIKTFLAAHPELEGADRDYAERAMVGAVL